MLSPTPNKTTSPLSSSQSRVAVLAQTCRAGLLYHRRAPQTQNADSVPTPCARPSSVLGR